MKAVNHAAISKTENFVWMKIVAQAIKTIKIAVVVKITQLSQKVVPVDVITAIHALQCHKYVILVQHAANNLAVIGILVEGLAVTSNLAEDLVLIKTLAVNVTDTAIVCVDFKDILILLVEKLLVYFEIG